MKLQCKICGSNNFSLDGEQVICGNCGCKYSIEEAKNLIQGNTTNSSTPQFSTSTTAEVAQYPKKDRSTTIGWLVLIIMLIGLAILIFGLKNLGTGNDFDINNILDNSIKLNNTNIKQYCSVSGEPTLNLNILNLSQSTIQLNTEIQGTTNKYEYQNVKIKITANIEYIGLGGETSQIGQQTKEILLDSQGNADLSFTITALNLSILQQGLPVSAQYEIEVISGKLIPKA